MASKEEAWGGNEAVDQVGYRVSTPQEQAAGFLS